MFLSFYSRPKVILAQQAVIFVTTTTILNYLAYEYILSRELEYLRYRLYHHSGGFFPAGREIMERFMPNSTMHCIFLPLITVNCAILG